MFGEYDPYSRLWELYAGSKGDGTMSDPRIDPNYRGVKCKGCGEYLPFLFNRLCTHCALEAKDAEIERLRAVVDAAQRLYSGGLYPENHEYVLISDRTLDALDEALDKLREVGDDID